MKEQADTDKRTIEELKQVVKTANQKAESLQAELDKLTKQSEAKLAQLQADLKSTKEAHEKRLQ